MRTLGLLLPLLLAACHSTGPSPSRAPDPKAGPGTPTRIVLRQFYKDTTVPLVLESLAGRDVVKLRSRPVKANQPPVAYVPDKIMADLVKVMREAGFDNYAGGEPPNPAAFGARAEISMRIGNAPTRALFIQPHSPKARIQAYVDCVKNLFPVYHKYAPAFQVTVGNGASSPFTQPKHKPRSR